MRHSVHLKIITGGSNRLEKDRRTASIVDDYGLVDYDGLRVSSSFVTVRPALWINLDF